MYGADVTDSVGFGRRGKFPAQKQDLKVKQATPMLTEGAWIITG